MKKINYIILFFSVILFIFPINVLGLEKETNNDVLTTSDIEIPQNGIPVVIIRIDESEEAINAAKDKDKEHKYGDISQMNESENHSVRCVGSIEIIVPDNFNSEFDLSDNPVGQRTLSYIRGRGNSTWYISDKKPYKIKYEEKTDVLGMGKAKEWGLLANSFDPTLVHNAVAAWMADQIGMEFSPKMVPVDLIMVGTKSGTNYLGSYYLSELTEIGKNRVNINELDEDELVNITGGYILSIFYKDQDSNEPEDNVFETKYSKVKLIHEEPSYEEGKLSDGQKAQRTYIRNYVNTIDDLIMNNEVIDETLHNEIGDYLDFKSTADFFLMQEFFINFDAYKTSSNYMYKKENGKLYWGPIWDFDLMFNMIDPEILDAVSGFNTSLPFPWLDKLRSNDKEFVKLIKSEWKVMNEKLIELTKKDGVLDQLKNRQKSSWLYNYNIWKDVTYFGNDTTLDKEIEILRTLIENRRKWFNDNIDNVGKVYSTVNYEVDGEIVRSDTIRTDSMLESINLKPQKDGLLFAGWVDKNTNESMEYKKVYNDLTLIPRYLNKNSIKDKINLFFSKYDVWVSLDDETYENNSIKVFPDEYDDLIKRNLTLTSSDPSVASIENGVVTLHKKGETTITATLEKGSSISYLLHVYDDSQEFENDPKDFTFEKDKITLNVGDYVQINYNYVSDKPVNPNVYIDEHCDIENEEIIERDYLSNYVIKGLKEGETTFTLTLTNSDTNRVIKKSIKVIVVSQKSDNKKNNNNVNNNNLSENTNSSNILSSSKKEDDIAVSEVDDDKKESINDKDTTEKVNDNNSSVKDNNTKEETNDFSWIWVVGIFLLIGTGVIIGIIKYRKDNS